jgi:hypothetical protein
MTRTMGDFEKTRQRTSGCDFFSALREKARFTLLEESTIGYNF